MKGGGNLKTLHGTQRNSQLYRESELAKSSVQSDQEFKHNEDGSALNPGRAKNRTGMYGSEVLNPERNVTWRTPNPTRSAGWRKPSPQTHVMQIRFREAKPKVLKVLQRGDPGREHEKRQNPELQTRL